MTLMCLCNTFKGLIAYVAMFCITDRNVISKSSSARFFLGLTESGLFPGVSVAQFFVLRLTCVDHVLSVTLV
jgi:hypothetical protein